MTNTPPRDLDLGSAANRIRDTVEASPHAEQIMNALCRDIGSRPAGSENMRRAAQYMADTWSALGAREVRTEDVSAPIWVPGPASLEIVEPDRALIDCIQAFNSGSTEVRAEIVDAGTAEKEDLAELGDRIRGCIVLMDGRRAAGIGQGTYVPRRVQLAQEAGACGVILTGHDPDRPYIEFIHPKLDIRITAMSVSASEGSGLVGLCGRGKVAARIVTSGRPAEGTCRNVIAELGPERAPEEIVIGSAHLDTFHISPGAQDNASGVIALTEAAHALAPFRSSFVRRLRLIGFTYEEMGFEGSKAYVRRHAEDLESIRFVLNLDAMLETTAQGVAVMNAPEMRDYIEIVLKPHHPDIDVRNLFCSTSDYLPFVLEGIPAARPADWLDRFPRWFHTTADVPENTSIEAIKKNAVMVAHLLLRLLTDSDLPARRKTPAEVRQHVEEAHASDLLRWKGCDWS